VGALKFPPTYEATDAYGINLTSNNAAWTARLGYTQSKITYKQGALELELPKNTYRDTTLQYNDGIWFVMAEATILDFDEGFRTRDANAVTLGHYFGQFLPYLARVHRYTTEKNNSSAIEVLGVGDPTVEEANKNITIGMRTGLTSKVSLTVEIAHYFDFEKVNGVRSNGVFNGDTVGSSVDIYTINLDAVF